MTSSSNPNVTADDDYTETIDRLRVFDEGNGWAIDGHNTETNKYTEACWGGFETREKAEAKAPLFEAELRESGITISASSGTALPVVVVD